MSAKRHRSPPLLPKIMSSFLWVCSLLLVCAEGLEVLQSVSDFACCETLGFIAHEMATFFFLSFISKKEPVYLADTAEIPVELFRLDTHTHTHSEVRFCCDCQQRNSNESKCIFQTKLQRSKLMSPACCLYIWIQWKHLHSNIRQQDSGGLSREGRFSEH